MAQPWIRHFVAARRRLATCGAPVAEGTQMGTEQREKAIEEAFQDATMLRAP